MLQSVVQPFLDHWGVLGTGLAVGGAAWPKVQTLWAALKNDVQGDVVTAKAQIADLQKQLADVKAALVPPAKTS